MEQHELTHYETFSYEVHFPLIHREWSAVCSCGWESRYVETMEQASELHRDHRLDQSTGTT